jgi:integration host factor subunit alpha
VQLANLTSFRYCPAKFFQGGQMTKADLIETVSGTCGFSKKESAGLVECVFSLAKECLQSGEDLKISGFGKFEVKQKKSRRGRNPHTGETLEISARRILSFKPSQLLKDALNEA